MRKHLSTLIMLSSFLMISCSKEDELTGIAPPGYWDKLRVVTIDNIHYSILDNEAWVSGSKPNLNFADIKPEISVYEKKFKVTSIRSGAFPNRNYPNGVYIPSSIVNIEGGFPYNGTKAIYIDDLTHWITKVKIEQYWNLGGTGGPKFWSCASPFGNELENDEPGEGTKLFVNGEEVKELTLPPVKTIKDCAFYNFQCEKIVVNDEIENINFNSFYNNQKLKKLKLGKNTKTIGERAFGSNLQLEEIDFGNSSIVSIGKEAFENCKSLKKIIFPESLRVIHLEAFASMVPDPMKSDPIIIEIPSLEAWINVEKEPEQGYSFFVFRSPYTLYVDNEPIYDVVVPDNITEIKDGGFSYSTITSITLPSTIERIGRMSFCWCFSLEKMIVNSVNPPKINSDVFDFFVREKCTLYVPAESLELYRTTDYWKDFDRIEPIENI